VWNGTGGRGGRGEEGRGRESTGRGQRAPPLMDPGYVTALVA